jgi:thioredoxin 1
VAVARLDIDEYPEIAARFDVLSIPTVMLFQGGEARGAVVGARPRAHFERWLAEVLPAGELDGLAVQGQQDA